MKRIIAGAMAALTLASAGAVAPASAQGWRGGYHHGGWGAGAAVGAGLLGLAVGAAIADHPHYGYGPGYGYTPTYGYAPGYGYAPAYEGCRTAMRWSPYWGDYQPVRVCD